MHKALLPAILFAIFSSDAIASSDGSRELLFGPAIKEAPVLPPERVKLFTQQGNQGSKDANSQDRVAVSKVKEPASVKAPSVSKMVPLVSPVTVPSKSPVVTNVANVNSSPPSLAQNSLTEAVSPKDVHSAAGVTIGSRALSVPVQSPLATASGSKANNSGKIHTNSRVDIVVAPPQQIRKESLGNPSEKTAAGIASKIAPKSTTVVLDVAQPSPIPSAAVVEQKKVEPEIVPAVVQLSLQPAVSISPEDDAYAQRARLLSRLSNSVVVGFQVSETSQLFSSDASFLPLLNNISGKSGIAVTAAYENSGRLFRQQIADNQFALLYVDAAMFSDAKKAGYEPLAQNDSSLTTSIVVLSNSAVKSDKDFSRAVFGTDIDSPLESLVASTVSRKGATSTKPMHARMPGIVTSALNNKVVDAIIVTSDVAEDLVISSAGKLRSFKVETIPVAFAWWVQPGMLAPQTIQALKSAISSARNDGDSSDRFAAKRHLSGWGIGGSFVKPDTALIESSISRVRSPAGISEGNSVSSTSQGTLRAESRLPSRVNDSPRAVQILVESSLTDEMRDKLRSSVKSR